MYQPRSKNYSNRPWKKFNIYSDSINYDIDLPKYTEWSFKILSLVFLNLTPICDRWNSCFIRTVKNDIEYSFYKSISVASMAL